MLKFVIDCILVLGLGLGSILFSAERDLGIFEDHGDLGKVKIAGNAFYNPDNQEYIITASGANMWFDKDEGHFLWKRLKGDFILRAEAKFVGAGVNAHRKMGCMIRSGLDSDAAYIDVAVHGDGLTALQFRRKKGQQTEEIKSIIVDAEAIQLARKGQQFIMSVAPFGLPFEREESPHIDLGNEVFVGLFVCSHEVEVIEKAIFRNVRLIIPAADDFIPYQDFIGSRLEILDIENGRREIVFESAESIQAPNWTADGRTLIYNSKGLLYKFDIEHKLSEDLNTDFANNNNNDHVLSFDGKMLGISHHSNLHNFQSMIYTVPVGGGKPKLITNQGPSYLHGWSPDNKYLVYTAQRDGNFDIYKIALSGGPEMRLTQAPGLDDGPEYTPDGQYIYFNSSRSGTMQLWRMKPDGQDQEQITDDEFNNWFPHISPDGKWIVFLSYAKEVNPEDHPFYKQVYLRLMPITEKKPRIIAYVYGGQGTINVPSWSPDSRKFAFVSNSK